MTIPTRRFTIDVVVLLFAIVALGVARPEVGDRTFLGREQTTVGIILYYLVGGAVGLVAFFDLVNVLRKGPVLSVGRRRYNNFELKARTSKSLGQFTFLPGEGLVYSIRCTKANRELLPVRILIGHGGGTQPENALHTSERFHEIAWRAEEITEAVLLPLFPGKFEVSIQMLGDHETVASMTTIVSQSRVSASG